MPTVRATNIGGLNLYINPLLVEEGSLIRSVNVDSYPYGAKTKRVGYATFQGTADGSAVTSLFSWTKNDGSLFVYRASGSKLYHSVGGTGAWTTSGNGTITAGNHVGYAVLGDTLIVGDGSGSTRHSTNGTSFTDTTLAPIGEHFAQFQNRIYIGGTASTMFYSTTGDATNWNTSGTSDSSSLTIPGEGKISGVNNINDRIIANKTSGKMFRWDGYSLVDVSTNLGPSSPYSVSQAEGYNLWLSRLGIIGYGGAKPQLFSNPIQSQIYNDSGNGIVGTVFDTAPAVTHRYDYMVAVGTVTDDFTSEAVNNAIIKYDFQKNEFLNYEFANFPKAFCSYKDAAGVQRLIFGDSSGQCYTFGGTAVTDNGSAIECSVEHVFHLNVPELDKKFKWYTGFFNPGCEAQVSIAISNTYTKASKKWSDLGDVVDGVVEYRFPEGSRGKLLFVRIKEYSTTSRFVYYGSVIDADLIPK